MKILVSSSNMLFRYSSEPMIPPVAHRYLSSPVHPIRPKIAYMYEHRDRNTLWWRVSVSNLNQFKRTIRSWCARRARIAFQDALKRQGFNRLGHPLCPSSAGMPSLLGSLEITIRPACVYQSFETVQKDADFLLKAILKQRDRRGEDAKSKGRP